MKLINEKTKVQFFDCCFIPRFSNPKVFQEFSFFWRDQGRNLGMSKSKRWNQIKQLQKFGNISEEDSQIWRLNMSSLWWVLIAVVAGAAFLNPVQGQGVAALQQQGMTPAQIHQRYPYYNYFQNSGNGPGYLYYNGYSHGDGKGESSKFKS